MVMMISFGRKIGQLEGGSECWISCILGGLEGIVRNAKRLWEKLRMLVTELDGMW